MERLRQSELRALLVFLRRTYAVLDLDAFRTHIVSALPRVIRSEITTFNEINPRTRRDNRVMHPTIAEIDTVRPGSEEIWQRHMLEHPLLKRYLRTRDGSAHKISDAATKHEFHRLGLYNELFRWVGIEHQLAISLPTPPDLMLAVALHRDRLDFSERERTMLNLLRPHLAQAYRNAEAFTRIRGALDLVAQTVAALPYGVVSLRKDHRILLATPRAEAMLAGYFGPPPPANRLPPEVERWVTWQEAALAKTDALGVPRGPLLVERNGAVLAVRLVTDPDRSLLVLEERATRLDPGALRTLGLSRRESEMLAWAACGTTSTQIACLAGISPRTVEKHLEHTYKKLGVQTRLAAVTHALDAVAARPHRA